jgi:hypothetical protein
MNQWFMFPLLNGGWLSTRFRTHLDIVKTSLKSEVPKKSVQKIPDSYQVMRDGTRLGKLKMIGCIRIGGCTIYFSKRNNWD